MRRLSWIAFLLLALPAKAEPPCPPQGTEAKEVRGVDAALKEAAETVRDNPFPLRPRTPEDAPRAIIIPKELQKVFDKLVKDSIVRDKTGIIREEREHGGLLVRDRDTAKQIQLMNPVKGTKNRFEPDFKGLDDRSKKIVGVFHTHPSVKENGQGNPLSDLDIVYLLTNSKLNPLGDDVMMAQSGEHQYLLLRTHKTPYINKAQGEQLQRRWSDFVFRNANSAWAKSKAAFDIARDYGLVYYEGKSGVLTRVDSY
jgi:proteasome lid subunit RPN8/RPN11